MRQKPFAFYAIAHGLLALPLLMEWQHDLETDGDCDELCGENLNDIDRLKSCGTQGEEIKDWEGRL